MSADQLTASGVFRVGDVLGQARRIFTGNLLFFLGAPVLVYAAMAAAVMSIGSLVGVVGGGAWPTAGIVILAVVAALAVIMVGQAVILLGAFQRLRGEPLRIGAALRRASARVLPLLGLAILWSLGLGICWMLSLVLPFGFRALGGTIALAYGLLVPLALVPPAFLFVVWVVVVPACVVEGLGPLASLLRSFDLTKGCRWKIFGIMLLMGIAALASKLIELVVARLSPVLAVVADVAWLVVLIAYWHCVVIMIYHDLRVAKEGTDTRQIAAIFD